MKLNTSNLVYFNDHDLDIAQGKLYREHPIKPKRDPKLAFKIDNFKFKGTSKNAIS